MAVKLIINGNEYDVEVRLADKAGFLAQIPQQPPQDDIDALLTGSVTTPWITGTNPDPHWIRPIVEATAEDGFLDSLLGDVIVEPQKLVMVIDGDNLSPEFVAFLKKYFIENDGEEHGE